MITHKTLKYIGLTLTYVAILLSCGKKEEECVLLNEPPISSNDLWDCHTNAEHSSEDIANLLVGKWDWKYGVCHFRLENAEPIDFCGYSLEFLGDNTVNVYQDNVKIKSTTWDLTDSYDSLFRIEFDEAVENAFGEILLCDNYLEFYSSPYDGCDSFYEKAQ